MAVDTKWDTVKLAALSKQLKEQKEVVEKNKEFLKNLNKEVETAWQGYAGRTFDERMEIDIENLEIFIRNLDELINDVDKVIVNCYEEAEETVAHLIQALKDSI